MPPVYATTEDFKTYAPRFNTLSDEDIAALLEAAERDLDNAVGPHRIDEATGRKFVPDTLSITDTRSLRDATCAQAEYRQVMGADFFVRGQFEEVQGPDYRTKGKLPRYAPAMWAHLRGTSMLRLTTSWGGRGDSPPWAPFAYG
jgi:hypothetical protein